MKKCNSNFSLRTLLALFCLIAFSKSAWSLPNQPIKQVAEWSKNHVLISKLKFHESREYGEPNFVAEGETSDASFTLNVWTDKNNTVTFENIDYRTREKISSSLLFERNNINGLLFIHQLYGEFISQDFKKSRYIRKEKDNLNNENHFYSGEKYDYQCSNDTENGIYHFSVLKISDLDKRIKGMIQFRKSGGGCC